MTFVKMADWMLWGWLRRWCSVMRPGNTREWESGLECHLSFSNRCGPCRRTARPCRARDRASGRRWRLRQREPVSWRNSASSSGTKQVTFWVSLSQLYYVWHQGRSWDALPTAVLFSRCQWLHRFPADWSIKSECRMCGNTHPVSTGVSIRFWPCCTFHQQMSV